MNLKWDAPTESDVDHYSVYAGTVSNFIPDLTALVGKSKDNSFNYLNSTGESTLYFRVRAVDKAGNQGQFSTEASNSITGLEEGKAIPTAFKLYQNYPNPFNPSATIKFDVAKEELIVLKVYNIIGQEVITLANRKMQPGSYETTWKASNAPTGLYMVRMTAGSYTSVMKMLLVK